MMSESPIKVRAILWDVGGTLLDWSSHQKAIQNALLKAGIAPISLKPSALLAAEQRYWAEEPTWRTLAEEEQALREIASLMLEGTEYADPEHIERLAHQLGHYEESYYFVTGIEDLLKALHALNVRQGIVSNWPPSLHRFLAYHGLTPFFPVVVGSGEEGVLKPDLSLFRRALDRLGIPPHEAVYVGNDPDLDILPARLLGMQAVHFDPRRRYAKSDAQDIEALRERLFAMLGLSTPGEPVD